jgi:hypothetical protein
MPATLTAPAPQLPASAVERSAVIEEYVRSARGTSSGIALEAALSELATAAEVCVPTTRSAAPHLSDAALLAQQRLLSQVSRQVELAAAHLAAEVAHRSRRELGYAGLAQRQGARTPEALIQSVTGASSPTARRLVRVGALVATLDEPESLPQPWLGPLLRGITSGQVSTEALDAVRVALGDPTETVKADALHAAAETLTSLVPQLTLESLAARARELRDELDASGVAGRENERRERRSLRLYPQVDGTTRLVALLDPESAAIITSGIDAATSPRRGGPRFVDPESADAAQRVIDDPRTTEQLAIDALVELVDVALRTRSTATPAARRADVRVLVTQRDLDRRIGPAQLDGQTATVTVATAERHACDGGLIPILFDDNGTALNLGRSQRLHSARQRIAIAARDGGCLAPGCERPASWCEVHHIHEFSRGGRTDLNDGVLLCRHHHMLVHNNGWRIERRTNRYWMLPPPTAEPPNSARPGAALPGAAPPGAALPGAALPSGRPRPILLSTKSAAVRRLLGGSLQGGSLQGGSLPGRAVSG